MTPEDTNPFGETVEVSPDDPVFDESVRPELPAGMDMGSTILDLLGKTFSGEPNESKDRDPFGEAAPDEPPKAESEDSDPEPKKKPEPIDNPFE